MGWFYGFKLHIVISDKGEIFDFVFTQANADDREPLKNICQIEHTRHRCFENFICNAISALVAYNFLPEKPSINLKIIDTNALKRTSYVELTLTQTGRIFRESLRLPLNPTP
jgi:hypothetical protein